MIRARPFSRVAAAALLLSAFAANARSQSGQIDQVSLRGTDNPVLWVGSPGFTVQQTVRTGIAGQLQGFEIYTGGPVGQVLDVRLRKGQAFSSMPVLWETQYTFAGNTPWEIPFFDTSSAGIRLDAGETFVLEFGFHVSSSGLMGTAAACYPEPTASATFNYNQRICFRTWMGTAAPGASYCTSEPTTAGPPARIWATGSASLAAQDLVLHAGPMPDVIAVFFCGTSSLQAPLGNGFLCVGNIAGRLPVLDPACGTIAQAFDPDLLSPGLVTPGATLHFQGWFRDPFGGGGPFGFDFTDGHSITFAP